MADDPELRELQMAQIRADIANKAADTEYKRKLTDYEPWRLVITAFLSGAATVGAIVGLLTFIFKH